MSAGITHGQEPYTFELVPERSPLRMPCTEARVILQMASVKLRKLGADMRSFETVALGDALEEMAGGETEAACQAVREAEAYRERRA